MWLTFSFICLTLGGITLLITVVLFIKWDAINIIRIITGSKARRGIQWYKDREDTNGEEEEGTVSRKDDGNHFATESLLAKTFNRTKDLALSRGLTRSRNVKSEEIISNRKIKPKTKGFNYTNGISQETSILSDNGAVPIGQHTEILSETELKHYGLDEKDSNLKDDSVSIDLFGDDEENSYDDFEDGLDSDKTSILTNETNNQAERVGLKDGSSKEEELGETTTSINTEKQNDLEEKLDSTLQEQNTNNELEKDDTKTSILVEEVEVTEKGEDSEIPISDGATSILMEEEPEENKTSILDSWDEISTPVEEVEKVEKKSKLVSDQVIPTKIEIEGVLDEVAVAYEEKEPKKETYSAKTQIITDEDKPDFKKVLTEDFESIEFHEYTVVRVESSYGVVDYK